MAADNFILPFQLESSHIRGRILRLGSVLDDILNPHHFTEELGRLTAENAVLAAMLSFMLKYDGIFMLQAQGDGPVRMLLADVTSAGEIRATARFDMAKVTEALKTETDLFRLIGKGHLAFTIDQGENTERYQGIVGLEGNSLAECVSHYFSQSEQIETALRVAVSYHDGHWRAGALMLQYMPGDDAGRIEGQGAAQDDNWNRAKILMNSCRDEELLAEMLTAEEVLFRLFHEEGVRVNDPTALSKGCRCSTEKLEGILALMPAADIDHMIVGERIVMTCEFCARDFVFDPEKVRRRMEKKG
jgi:molecular chaperone Hsp33